ncbi:MAG: tetratricopeptide repeat protein [Chloroflexi bacterium]|nr:tetratricopeptide repeat protein [Chloroflexota bacterium]
MAVVTELIEAGLRLKGAGNLRGAIEHFKQLHATYPDHARIMFELAATWRLFGVPEQALPLYIELLALPKDAGLPPKDMPRLYTQLGATLLEMGDEQEALAIIDEGLALHPSYRSLRAWRLFALSEGGAAQLALLEALELMLESLAPSRWDIFEDDIKALVKAMRADLSAQSVDRLGDGSVAEQATADSGPPEDSVDRAMTAEPQDASEADDPPQRREIAVASEAADTTAVDVAVNLVEPKKRPGKARAKTTKPRSQMGKKAVRIDISGESDEPAPKADDDADAAPSGTFKIPIDPD